MVKPLEEQLEPGAREKEEPRELSTVLWLSLTALGVVYGDIGTSPLYAVKTCFFGQGAISPEAANIFGVVSLIFWSLIIVISVKYMTYVLNADNRGEGGILALMSLVHPRGKVVPFQKRWLLVNIGLFGAALLYGGINITPAISVLSSVEGLEVATHSHILAPYIVPITIVILILLFAFQSQGTRIVGSAFGPVMIVWFTTIAALGLSGIVRRPDILAAVNPAHGIRFFLLNGWPGFLILGSVFLVVTGGEALYADRGHFGKTPIRAAWFCLVLPALLLNYFGQGALLLENPATSHNPFYLLAPTWGIYPLVFLATVATVIASQAVISGAFSLTRQAIQLGFWPRMKVDHTSAKEIGQIYVSTINWILMFATIGLVLGFRKSTNLAGAYGVAVSTTMVITTLLIGVVAHELWNWKKIAAVAVAVLLLIPDLSFFLANLTKIPQGGWFPILVAILMYTLMSTWSRGKALLEGRVEEGRTPVEKYLEGLQEHPPQRVEGTSVYLTGNSLGVPQALQYQLEHNKVLHERVVLLTLFTENFPRVWPKRRLRVEKLNLNFYRVIALHGFMEDISMSMILRRLKSAGLDLNMEETSFFLGRENIVPVKGFKMNFWRARLFSLMAKNAMPITDFLQIPSDRVIELGVFVEL
jgi:KUP system potassium uptake protein